jgi:phenylpropionate dioxygenase-like ring-hydroxylating dioxygenase large terminal subunit
MWSPDMSVQPISRPLTNVLRFWHPVMLSRDLPRDKAAGAQVAERSLALFRSGPDRVGALGVVCPHRRMRLSLGTVQDGRLTCPYHGWSFDCDGNGESPGTPKLYACAEHYDCRDAHGVIWVKAPGPDRPLPDVSHPGFVLIKPVVHAVRAPLQLVIDNFSEIEHTSVRHPDFGLDPARVHEAVVTYEDTDDAVTATNVGPAKPPPFLTRRLLLFRRRFLFHSDYTFRFDPPRVAIDHYWTDPAKGGKVGLIKYRVHVFFVPVDQQNSQLVTFAAAHSRWPCLPRGGVPLMAWHLRQGVAQTVAEDVWLLENLADQTPEMEGMKLSRFDRILGMTREKLRRIYLGDGEGPVQTK